MRGGFYLMHRGWMQSGDFRPEPFTDREAYLWSIEQAAIRPHRQWFNGVPYDVGRGEFVTSQPSMASALGWSEKRVRAFTQRMVKAEKWAKRGANAGAKAPTVLTVCNYDAFQAPQRPEGEAKGEGNGERRAKRGRSEGEEQKEEKNKGNEGERRERAPAQPYPEALSIWAEAAAECGWTPVNPGLGDKRRDRLRRTLEKEGLAGWREGIARARQSELLRGPDPPSWFNFDFLIQHDNFLKVKDGNYDRQFTGPSNGRGSGWGAAYSLVSQDMPV